VAYLLGCVADQAKDAHVGVTSWQVQQLHGRNCIVFGLEWNALLYVECFAAASYGRLQQHKLAGAHLTAVRAEAVSGLDEENNNQTTAFELSLCYKLQMTCALQPCANLNACLSSDLQRQPECVKENYSKPRLVLRLDSSSNQPVVSVTMLRTARRALALGRASQRQACPDLAN
jgi:hypothetical protein